jgi:predicted lipid-binding transport protein (Tim44 family)
MMLRLLTVIVERQGNGQNSAPSGGGGGGGGFGGGGDFFLFALLFGGHGAGLIVLLVLVGGFFALSYFRGGRGFGGLFGMFGGLGGGGGGRAGGGGGDGIGSSYGAGQVPAPIPPLSNTPRTAEEASAYGSRGASVSGPGGAYDDSHPVGVPESFRGAMLDGSATTAAGKVEDVDGGLAAIKAHDPQFEAEAFLGQAQTSFFTIQQAWTECKPEMSRAVMADGLAQQTAMQLEEYRRDNKLNRLDGLTVSDARIVGAHSDNVYDTVTVRFSAASADYDVDAKSGRMVKGHKDIEAWTEDWIFQRSSGAVTKPAGLMSHKCPNCGAPINVNAEGICEYCHQQVMSGKYDWVLSRIDQVGAAMAGRGYSSGW